jgi:uncharacterized membrane protein
MLLEGIGAMWVLVGLIFAMAELISAHMHRCPSTSISITWDDVTAVIRTGLSFFLSREIQEFAETR